MAVAVTVCVGSVSVCRRRNSGILCFQELTQSIFDANTNACFDGSYCISVHLFLSTKNFRHNIDADDIDDAGVRVDLLLDYC